MDEEHRTNLEKVISRLEDAGLRLRKHKCTFFTTEVVNQTTDVKLTQSWRLRFLLIWRNWNPLGTFELLWKVHFPSAYAVSASSPNITEQLSLEMGIWATGSVWHMQANVGISASTSALYDGTKDLIVLRDPSPFGVGAVLAHRETDGLEHPFAFASRSLTPAERNYSHLDKEGLTIIFAVKYFHQHLFGRHFLFTTDHKPL